MVKNKGGVQSKLNALARTSEFQRILQQEVKDHKLVLQDVQKCVGTIYREVCKRPHGNTGFITLNEGEFTMGELVVLISFFRLQSNRGVTMEGLRQGQIWADAGFGSVVRERNRRVENLVARRGVVCFHCLRSISIICLLPLSAFNFYHFAFLDCLRSSIWVLSS